MPTARKTPKTNTARKTPKTKTATNLFNKFTQEVKNDIRKRGRAVGKEKEWIAKFVKEGCNTDFFYNKARRNQLKLQLGSNLTKIWCKK
jgi:hypothetical protein